MGPGIRRLRRQNCAAYGCGDFGQGGDDGGFGGGFVDAEAGQDPGAVFEFEEREQEVFSGVG